MGTAQWLCHTCKIFAKIILWTIQNSRNSWNLRPARYISTIQYMHVHTSLQMANSVQYCLPPGTSSPASLTTSDSPTSTARKHYFSSAPGARPPSHAHQEQAKRSMAAAVTSPRSVSTLPSSPSQRTTSNSSYGMVDICSLPAIRLARQVTCTVHVIYTM